MLRGLALAAVVASMLLACADEDLAPSPASTEAPATPSVEASPASSTPEAPTPVPTYEAFPAGLWLIDVTTGELHVLYEGEDYPLVEAGGFRRGGALVSFLLDDVIAQSDLDGGVKSVPRGDGVFISSSTDERVVRARAEGEWHVTVDDIALGPEVYNAEAAGTHAVLERPGRAPETYALEVLDLGGGGRRTLVGDVQIVLGHGAPAAISPEGGFYLDTHVDATYLYDLETLDVTDLGAPWFFDEAPSWAPDRDLLLVPDEAGEATILDPAGGSRLVFEGSSWPAKWSAGGAHVYWGEGDSTVIADASTGERLEAWAGHPSAYFWDGRVPVADAEAGPAALLATATGTWMHHPALEAPRFIEDADGGTWSPDASRAAIAVRTSTGQFEEQRWDIVVLDVRGGSRTVASDAQSSYLPPDMWWNEAGTHLLIRFPGGEWP